MVLKLSCSVLEAPEAPLPFEAFNFAVALPLPRPAVTTPRMLGTACRPAFWPLMLRGDRLQAESPGLLCPQRG